MNSTLSRSLATGHLLFACFGFTLSNGFASETPLILMSQEGCRSATVFGRGEIQYRTAGSDSVERRFYICHPQALAFDQETTLLAAAGGCGSGPSVIKVWRLGDGMQLCSIAAPGQSIKAVTLSLDGTLVLGASSEGRVSAWRVSDGVMQWTRCLASGSDHVKFSANGLELSIQGADGKIQKLDPASGRNLVSSMTLNP